MPTFTKYDEYMQTIVAHGRFQSAMSGIQTGVMVAQTGLLSRMGSSLNALNSQIDELRQQHQDVLAIQQEFLRREQLQADIEEFVFTTEKMVQEFSQDSDELSPSQRYFALKGVLDTVETVGLATPLIRGRDNKAAFENVMDQARKLYATLSKHPETMEALEWVAQEQARQAEAQRKLADIERGKQDRRQRIADQANAAIANLQSQVTDLEKRKRLGTVEKLWNDLTKSFQQWPPAIRLFAGIAAAVVSLFFLWPFLIIAFVIYHSERKQNDPINVPFQAEIEKLQRQIAEIAAKARQEIASL